MTETPTETTRSAFAADKPCSLSTYHAEAERTFEWYNAERERLSL